MIRYKKSKHKLVVRDIPFADWLAYLWFALFSGGMLALWIWATFVKKDASVIPVEFALGVVFLAVGTYLFLNVSTTTTVINHELRTVEITKRGILSSDFASYSFNRISAAAYVKEVKNRGILYSIQLPIDNGEIVELAYPRGRKEGQLFAVTEVINAYLGIGPNAEDFKLTIFYED